MQSSATSAGRGSTSPSWGIEQQCPQCGAPVCLDETDRLLVCDYCRVRLILVPPATVRTFLPPRNPSLDGLVFIPYWRMKGQTWSFGADGMRSSIIDMTQRAATWAGLPPSLGVRPQAMKLRFVSPDTPGRFARVGVSFEAAVAARWKSLDDLEEEPPFHRILIGETSSVIYQPVRFGKGLEDAILDRSLGSAPAERPDLEPLPSSGSASPIRFLSTVCPNCGSDLVGERDSLVQICSGCRRAWTVDGGALVACPCHVVESAFAPDIHLPFWRTRAAVDGLELRTFDDLIRHAQLPTLGRSSARRGAAISFWTPAFKIHPEHWARMARTLTLRQADACPSAEAPGGEVIPVTLASKGTPDAIRIVIAALAGVKEAILPKIVRIQVREANSELVYVPFRASAHEISHPEMLVALSRNLLSFGRNI